jgi:dolichol-phosphate mannosyltransferase
VLIDDDSDDGTVQAVLSLNLPFVKAFCRRDGKGLGSAVGYGVREAQGDVLVVMDSDFNHQPEYISRLLESLEHYDCVTGSRFLRGGGMTGRWHYAFSFVFNRFVHVITGGNLTDYSCGFFAVMKSALNVLDFSRIFYGHGDYSIRLFFYLERAGMRIKEIPVINGARRFGQANGAYVRNLIRYVSEVIKLTFKEQVKLAR